MNELQKFFIKNMAMKDATPFSRKGVTRKDATPFVCGKERCDPIFTNGMTALI